MARSPSEDDIRSIYLATIDGLYAFVLSRADGDRDLAEDVVQESWLRAVRSWHADGLPDNPQAWLTTVARNLLTSHFRRRPHEVLDDSAAASSTESSDSIEARASLLSRALARLAPPHRALLKAFHFDRRPVADIANAHGISERAVEGRLRRARATLRHQIESDPDHEGESS